jgi:hypothetical protein
MCVLHDHHQSGSEPATQILTYYKLQNKILRISLNAPWLTRNTQIHRETNTPTIKDIITTLTLNFHSRLPLATGVLFYNIGQPQFTHV